MPESRTLSSWLDHLGKLHPKAIAMGLDRVEQVRNRMRLDPDCKIVTVTGTNGKGSTCAMLEAMLSRPGFLTGLYTSPHLLRFNERIRIGGIEASDHAIVAAFAAVEAARGEIQLTYFEFATLAALWLFREAKVDVAILEVGLGGRLDAVNVFDADCAVITSIDFDHMDYLGDTREAIGFEKAGIMRAGRPCICSEGDPPQSVLRHAGEIGAQLRLIGRDFDFSEQGDGWRYRGKSELALPLPALAGKIQLRNAATALAAIEALGIELTPEAIGRALQGLQLKGRFQLLRRNPEVILDVSHNPQGARVLAQNLADFPCTGRTIAVFSMLSDKDIAGVIETVADQVDAWHVAPLIESRAAGIDSLLAACRAAGATQVVAHASVLDAYLHACKGARENDRILVFGSFHTVAAVLES